MAGRVWLRKPWARHSGGATVFLGLVVGAVVSASNGASAIPQDQASQATFRAGVDLVRLDVSVLDKDRQPVRGLTAADFTVRENDVPRPIDVFSEIDLPGPPVDAAGWMSRTPSDVETNGADSERLIVILLDDVMIPQDPLFVQQTKRIAREVINEMGPRDAATVVFSRDGHHAQSFTTDKTKLFAAVDTFNGGMAFTAGGDDFSFWVASEITLADVADALIALPDKRKVLVFVSEGVNHDLPATAPRITLPPGATLAREEAIRVDDLARQALDRLLRANVSVYSFDPGGLAGLEGFTHANAGKPSPFKPFHEYMVMLANGTGGRPTIYTNDPMPGIHQMFAENASYYLVGYRPATPPKADEYRRVDVKVDRKGAEVRARHVTDTPPTPEERAKKAGTAPPPPALEAIANVLPDASVPLRVTLIPLARPDGPGAILAAIVGVRQPAPQHLTTESLHLVLRAFTMDGNARGEAQLTAPVTLTPSTNGAGDVRSELASRLDVTGSGHYSVRIGVEAAAAKTAGSVYADVDVPDFRAPLQLSGIALTTAAAPPAVASALRPVLPVTPTTERDFAATTNVTAFARVYEGARAKFETRVTCSVRDSSDAVVFTHTDTLAAGRFSGSTAVDVTTALPLDRLAPGPYLLSIEATGHDRVVTRELTFKVH